MTQNETTNDLLTPLPEAKKRPDMLNVLTILTFIGSGVGIISAFWTYVSAQKNYDNMVQAQSKLDSAPEFVKKLAGPEMLEISRRGLVENRMPIMLLSILGCALCIYAAMQMRALKKSGFSIYLVGEILPLIVSYIFLGAGIFTGFVGIIAIIFPLVFIILYATQLKHLS